MQIIVELARHPARFTAILALGIAVTIAFIASNALAVVTDSGTVDVRVPNNSTSVVDAPTGAGAFVSYFGDNDVTFGSAGTGVFDPFVRLQAAPTESGYNTNGTLQFDTKSGTWTHAIKVSSIPQRPCPSGTCFELFNDINESNAQQNAKGRISLNKVEVFYADSATVTGYPVFGGLATLEYAFNGDILINDVNQGSGRGDLRYMIPIDGAGGVSLPADCDYGNPACSKWFVLYSEWGLTPTGNAPFNDDFTSDGGFEEWKVKIYPAISLTKTPNPADVCNGSSTDVTYTYVVTNNSPGGGSVNGTIVDDNGTPANTGDDVTVGTFSKLAAGASATFTHVFSVSGTRINIATATATDPDGQTATATATATVNAHECTISLTKTPDIADVCIDAGTEVTFTYVVTNTSANGSNPFTVSGTLVDDIDNDGTDDVTVGSWGPLGPGDSATLTHTRVINTTTTNEATATGTFTDSSSTEKKAQATATVTAHECSTFLTKTPSATVVSSGTAVTYTYLENNDGDAPLVNVSVVDDKCAPVDPVLSGGFNVGDTDTNNVLDPGETWEFTCTAVLTQTTTNVAIGTATFQPTGTTVTFCDPANAPANTICLESERATATVEVPTEGCTPGYWRQEQHYDSWVATGYSPSDLFSAVFGRLITIDYNGPITDPTLGEAVYAQGGEINYIARHGTAALLNAAHPDVNFGYTVAQVIAAVQAAIDANDASLISDLAAQNEAGCLLN